MMPQCLRIIIWKCFGAEQILWHNNLKKIVRCAFFSPHYVCCHPTWRRGVSARDMEAGGHWDTLAKSSSTSSWCRVSWGVPGSCRAITMALVLSARNMRWRHRSRAWLTSCLALDTPHGACSMEGCYYTGHGLRWGGHYCVRILFKYHYRATDHNPTRKLSI